jgi:hypothetical protein
VWAYKYWEVEKNAREGLVKLGDIIVELVKTEFKDLADKVNFLRNSKVCERFI